MPKGPCLATGYEFLTLLKECGKNDTFTPQVWWGDNGARRVERQPASGGFPKQWDQLRHCCSRGTGSRRHRSVICIRADRGNQSGGDVG